MDTEPLNQNELETLRILWERGESKPADIEALFSWPIENATLRSVLMNLLRKRQVSRRREGKAFFYAARLPKRTLFQSMISRLAEVFAGGSHRELVAQLVESGDLKREDLVALKRVADQGAEPERKGKSL